MCPVMEMFCEGDTKGIELKSEINLSLTSISLCFGITSAQLSESSHVIGSSFPTSLFPLILLTVVSFF